ncbi:cytochrome c oxidase assembly protein COX20, mitochondrial [Lissotriton helveticus]
MATSSSQPVPLGSDGHPGSSASAAGGGSLPQSAPSSDDKSFKLLGFLDVQNTPCARESILYGSLGSLVAGLGHFLATSRVRRSCDVGVGGFIFTTLTCWMYCRVNNAKLRMQQKMIQEGLKNRVLYEGTSIDPTRKDTNSNQGSRN